MKINQQNISPRRFVFTVLTVTTLMFGLSYALHGLVFTDFDKVAGDLGLGMQGLLPVVALIYFILSTIITTLLVACRFNSLQVVKSTILGGILGGLVFYMSFSLGTQFHSSTQFMHLLVNVSWQVVEQGIGGMLAGGIIYANLDRGFFAIGH